MILIAPFMSLSITQAGCLLSTVNKYSSGCLIVSTTVVTPSHHYAYIYESKGHTSLLGHEQRASLGCRPSFNDNQIGIPQLIEHNPIKYKLTHYSIIVPPNEEESDRYGSFWLSSNHVRNRPKFPKVLQRVSWS
jgi:hypothetical protein